VLFDPSGNVFIGTIRPNQFETTPAIIEAALDPFEQFCQNKFAAIAIRDTCPMD